MKVLKNALLIAGLASISSFANAQITIAPENDSDFKLKFIGRTNIDLGTHFQSFEDGKDAPNGLVVNDTRLGFVANKGDWETKVEICYTNKAISFRDLYVRYNWGKTQKLTIGNQFMPYGEKITGINYKFVEDPAADYTFCSARKIGANYLYTTDAMNLTAGLYSDGNVDAKAINQGLNFAAQAIFRPVYNETTIFHIGGAFIHTDSDNEVSYSGVIPVSFETRSLIATPKFKADNIQRYEAEILFIKSKFLAEAHFLGSSVNAKDYADRQNFNGFWAQASYQIKGEKQNYNKVTARPTASGAGTLEILGRFDHVNLDDYGSQNDFQVGLNYFFNKHVNLKMNYVFVQDKIGNFDENYNAIQARLQFSF